MNRLVTLSIYCILLAWTTSGFAYENGDDVDAISITYFQHLSYQLGDGELGFSTVDQACHSYARTETAKFNRLNKDRSVKIKYEYTGKHMLPEDPSKPGRPDRPEMPDGIKGTLYDKPAMHEHGICSIKITATVAGRTFVELNEAKLDVYVECPDKFHSYVQNIDFFCIYNDKMLLAKDDPELKKFRLQIKRANAKILRELGGRM